jgi:hypothetical protein
MNIASTSVLLVSRCTEKVRRHVSFAPSTVVTWIDGVGVNGRKVAAALLFIEHFNLFDKVILRLY